MQRDRDGMTIFTEKDQTHNFNSSWWFFYYCRPGNRERVIVTKRIIPRYLCGDGLWMRHGTVWFFLFILCKAKLLIGVGHHILGKLLIWNYNVQNLPSNVAVLVTFALRKVLGWRHFMQLPQRKQSAFTPPILHRLTVWREAWNCRCTPAAEFHMSIEWQENGFCHSTEPPLALPHDLSNTVIDNEKSMGK